MFDSIVNVNDFLSEHWLAEVFPSRLRDLTRRWRDDDEHGKATPWHGLQKVAGGYLTAKAELPEPRDDSYADAVTRLHTRLLSAVGITPDPIDLETTQGDRPVTVPLLTRAQSTTGEALHVLQANPVSNVDELFADEATLVSPVLVHESADRVQQVASVKTGVQQLLLTDHRPRYLLVLAGAWVVLTDVARWSEGRYLAFDVDTALSRRDAKASGELACHAGLWSGDVLLPGDDGSAELDAFTQDSVKHAVGVSEDLREGLRLSIELLGNEIIRGRRAAGEPVEGIAELPREITQQSLRFLYRILFLLYAEARPELGILPVGALEYSAGYGLDRLRELIQVPLTESSRNGGHLHASLQVLFRLVNDGVNHTAGAGHDELVFEPLRADLFDPDKAPLIDRIRLRNSVVQEVLQLLLLSKPSKRKGQRGYVSYAQLGINQLGAVYEGLMSYSGFIAGQDLMEFAKDGDADKGSWLVPVDRASDYGEEHVVRREDRLTGEQRNLIHPKGSFVFRLSGRDRQRSASYYTPEVLTRCVVTHSLAELLPGDMPASDILDLRVCEPALGSGAFLNETINQLATAYLDRRQRELDQQIPPERYVEELQRVKAHLALHRCYGVDLNQTAVELAEVSLWLNVMHPGLQAPWFGLHLRRGNSLIGARRATYDLGTLNRSKKTWLNASPVDRPLTGGPVPPGEIHHFLLPAKGWGAVGDTKQAKELRPEQAEALRAWWKRMRAKPDKRQADRLRGLATRVERLWTLTARRMEISEAEIARRVDVWGADQDAVETAVTRERVEVTLKDPDSPYQRLRLVMDAWCALWFWPVTTEVKAPTLEEWLTVLEGLLGVEGKAAPDSSAAALHESIDGFDELAQVDELEKSYYAMRDVFALVAEHPWLGVVRDIAQREGFFHWELDFAQVFRQGGFDVQVGNPPWVRLDWSDSVILGEHDPFFQLQAKIPERTFRQRRSELLAARAVETAYLDELAGWSGLVEHLGSPVEHRVLEGLRSNLYMNFMERTWRNLSPRGIIGLLHPESHFTDPKAGILREATYRRLRGSAHFIKANRWFEGVDSPSQTFGMHLYGQVRNPWFWLVTNIQSVDTLDSSLIHDGQGEVPGIEYPWGGLDLRPHASRVMAITEETLAEWTRLFDPPGTPFVQARMVRPLTQEQLDVLATLANAERRMSDTGYQSTSGWNETTAKDDGFIEWRTEFSTSWDEVVLQGPHFTVATPFAKQPNENCYSKADYSTWNLEALPESVIPRTNYQRACDRDRYNAGLTHWNGRPYTDHWILVWRKMTQPGSERSLHAALFPPGPALSGNAQGLAVPGRDHATAMACGLWASLPFDYLIKVSGKTNIYDEQVNRFPAPLDHPAGSAVLLRTLRLNCLTRDYAPLWEELYEDDSAEDSWTPAFTEWPRLGVGRREWTLDTPLRTDFERRAALVEIDALVALMLGLSAEQLALMYRAQFPVLRKYEYEMFFDNQGQKIARSHHAAGVNQGKADYALVAAYCEAVDLGERPTVDLPPQYEPPFLKPDREAEMRTAYAEFARRLGVGD